MATSGDGGRAQEQAGGRRIRGAGGTPGGIGTFFFGLWGWSRSGGFGLTMLPLLIGIGFLFFDGRSVAGWVLSVGGALIILAAILMGLSIHWEPTSLFNTIMMFGMLAAGLGLVFRSLRAYSDVSDTA